MKLYELAGDYRELMDKLESGELSEELLSDTLEGIRGAIEEKADNIACLLKNIESDCEAIRVEEINLAERRKSKEKTRDKIKQYLSDMLTHAGVLNVETGRNRIAFRKSKSVEISDETKFIEWAKKNRDDFLSYKEPTINKSSIKNAIASGEKIDGVYIQEKMNIQIK